MNRFPIVAIFLCSAFSVPAFADGEQASRLREEAKRIESTTGDSDLALRKMDEAVAAAPEDPEIRMSRAWMRSRAGDKAGAIVDAGDAIRLWEAIPGHDPDRVAHMHFERATFFRFLDRSEDALPDCDEAARLAPGKKWPLQARGAVMVELGDVDGGIALIREAATEDPTAVDMLAPAQFLQADWDGLKDSAGKLTDGSAKAWWTVVALMGKERFQEAWQVAAEFHNANLANGLGVLALAWVEGTPGQPAANLERAVSNFELMLGYRVNSSYVAAYARTLFLMGRFAACRDLLATRGSDRSFISLFWLGAAQWKLDQLAEARETLRAARRLNPYTKVWVAKIPGLDTFFASIDAEIGKEAGAKGGAVGLAKESATWLLTTAEIEALVRRCHFSRAVAEYGKLLPGTVSPIRKKEIEIRLAEVKSMAAALEKLIAGVNKKPGTLKSKVGAQELTLSKADALAFEFTIAKGTGKFPWGCLELAEFLRLAGTQTLTPDERFGLAIFQWDLGQATAAQAAMADALKASAALKDRVTLVVARKRGLEPPAGGFVVYKGAFVTAEEKTNLEKGLVRFKGDWVPAADRESLAKGLVKVGDKWMPGDEKKLQDAGFRKQDGKWMAGEDYDALVSQWDHAIVQETAHYTIKSNAGEAFVKDLATVLELAYTELKSFYDGREPKLPKDEKMTLYCFRTFEEYRRHCVERHCEGEIKAAGFAASDSNIVAGWNMTGDFRLFLQTMVHEAAHLYYYRTSTMARWPSWYMEGMATYFEGFSGSSGAWKFSFANPTRLPGAKSAIAGAGFIPLKDLLSGDAGALINSDTSKALVFYSECWALNYFLTKTSDPAIAKAYRDYRAAMSSGKVEDFTKYFPDLDALEKTWKAFGAGM
ncbi:MAG: tetratricopeptide repeat protein [Planctomycetes bacterium]|nr:tetratricopeptide repeat protein [Planctomycetota bacterium]